MSHIRWTIAAAFFLLLTLNAAPPEGHCQPSGSQNKNQETDPSQTDLTPCNRAVADWQLDDAIALCSEEIGRSPKDATLYNTRALAYYLKQNYDAAIADYSKAINLDPKEGLFYTNRGMAYIGNGLFDRAIVDFDRAIAMDPQSLLAYVGRGRAYVGKGLLDRAIAEYTRSLEIGPFWPDKPRVLIDRGDAYFRQENYELALSDYQSALGTNQSDFFGDFYSQRVRDDPYTFLRTGRTLCALARYQEASREFQEGLTITKDAAQREALIYEMGMCFVAQGDYEQGSRVLGDRKIIGFEISKVPEGFGVERVFKGSSADLAGIKVQDTITEFNGEGLAAIDLRYFIDTLVAEQDFGSKVTVKILRSGASLEKSVVVGIPASLPALAKEEDTAPVAGVSEAPVLELRKLEIKPESVVPGASFDLVVEYFVSDSSARQEQILVQLSFAIFQDGKVLYSPGPAEVLSYNAGRITKRIEPLKASTRRGVYSIEVSLAYKNFAAEKSIDLRIE